MPWAFDEPGGDPETSAVEVARRSTRLELALAPYLQQAGLEAHERGVPVLRAMQLDFPGDPAVGHLERQHLLGGDLLVAPVLSETGDVVRGGGWRAERHEVTSMPLWVREDAVLVTGTDPPGRSTTTPATASSPSTRAPATARCG